MKGRINSLPKLSALAILISQFCITGPAFAAGFQLNEISPALQGDATAGSAAANNDVSSMFTNPATLSTLLSSQFYVGGSEIMPHVDMSNASAIHTVNVPGIPPSSITAPVVGSTSQNGISSAAFAPDIYFGYRIDRRLVAGLAVISPYGLTTRYDNDSVLRFIAQLSQVRTIDIVPAISYTINDEWAVGIGFQAQYLQAAFSNFNGPYTSIPAIDAFIAATQPTYLKASGWGYGYTLGLYFTPDAVTRLGVGFRSQVSEQISGYGRQFTMPGDITPAPSQAFLFNASSNSYAAVKTPAVLTFSAARDFNAWTLKASAQINFWNTFNQLTINLPAAFATTSTLQTRWRNTILAAIGADYHVNKCWVVRGGFAYDETPTNSTYRDPRIPDSDRYWLSFGASYAYNHNLSFDAAYTHLFIRNQSVNVTQASGSSLNSTVPLEVNTASANYKGSADIVALALRYSF